MIVPKASFGKWKKQQVLFSPSLHKPSQAHLDGNTLGLEFNALPDC